MARQKISSKVLSSIGYNSETKELEVEFLTRKSEDNRRVYRYAGVPAEIYEKLMAAESKGSFFLTYVRPNYECKRIEQTHDQATPTAAQEEAEIPGPDAQQKH